MVAQSTDLTADFEGTALLGVSISGGLQDTAFVGIKTNAPHMLGVIDYATLKGVSVALLDSYRDQA